MKKTYIPIIILVIAAVGAGIFFLSRASKTNSNPQAGPATPPPKPVNLIPVSERPYVTLAPLTSRNDLQIVIHDLKKAAGEVEVTLEYDRNKGVLDAVLRHFRLDKLPYTDTIFMGSKSAGGHITYHDDVIGGKLLLEFEGENEYALEVPWRYDDTQKQYDKLSTTDGKFQVSLATPIKQSKILVMQSPGLPGKIEGELLAGPYLFRSVGQLPKLEATVAIRLAEENQAAVIMGWDGAKWTELKTTIEGKTATTTDTVKEAYIVTTKP